MNNEQKRWKREGKFNEHHLTPRSRGGHSNPENLITLDVSRHICWHFLFGNLTIDEVIEMLKRLKRCQKNRKCKTKHKRTKRKPDTEGFSGAPGWV